VARPGTADQSGMNSYTESRRSRNQACGGGRRRIHRPRDGGEPGPPWLEVTLIEKLNQVMPRSIRKWPASLSATW